MNYKLSKLLQLNKGITAIIGGGGKTTLMMTLAKELAEEASVIVTTSTKILKPDFCKTLFNPSAEEIRESLTECKMLCVASLHESGKLAAQSISFSELSKLADYVLVEADGSKHLPIKAHADFEPVIPKEVNQTIYVIGIDGLGKKISEVCHRPEIFTQLAECEIDTNLTSELLAKALKKEALADRFYINKIESEQDWQVARELASLLNKPVLGGDLLKGEYKCLS